MLSYKRMARSASVLLAAGCVALTIPASPAYAASGSCQRDSVCLWSKEHFTGQYGRIDAMKNQCYSTRSVGAKSMTNHTRFLLNVYSKPGCKGKVFSMNWNVKLGDGFPFPAKSFKTGG
ncbi:peptidase inhibitor family I36 protein [Streptomyces sp. bgisy100]|uniref:peptidase inhibitor family I36 protein n=1 Tax=Streptomyces sp. bgisy100 TaxID=3413783 RepID=UPI003D723B69